MKLVLHYRDWLDCPEAAKRDWLREFPHPTTSGCRIMPEAEIRWPPPFCTTHTSTRSMPGKRNTAAGAVSEVQELKQLCEENGRPKKLVADLSLDKDALQSIDGPKSHESCLSGLWIIRKPHKVAGEQSLRGRKLSCNIPTIQIN